MSAYLIDQIEDIARRLKELEADQQLALTGSSAPVKQVGEVAINWGYGAADYDPA